ncbi:MAG: hypothetical protein Kow0069_02670 [Promethearchaeota archaeon]
MPLKEKYKIALTGLDEAGKTSILVVLNKKFDFMAEVENLSPTHRVSRDVTTYLGQKIYRWDYGGQSSYREDYLAKRDDYFSGVSLLVYVVDVLDDERVAEAVDYFGQVTAYLSEASAEVPVSVFLHKCDPDVRETPQVAKRLIRLQEMLLSEAHGLHVDFYQTTIYDAFTVFRAMSHSLARLFEKPQLISAYLEDVASSLDLIALVVVDHNGLLVGEFYRPHLQAADRELFKGAYEDALRKLDGGELPFEVAGINALVQVVGIGGEKLLVVLAAAESAAFQDEKKVREVLSNLGQGLRDLLGV